MLAYYVHAGEARVGDTLADVPVGLVAPANFGVPRNSEPRVLTVEAEPRAEWHGEPTFTAQATVVERRTYKDIVRGYLAAVQRCADRCTPINRLETAVYGPDGPSLVYHDTVNTDVIHTGYGACVIADKVHASIIACGDAAYAVTCDCLTSMARADGNSGGAFAAGVDATALATGRNGTAAAIGYKPTAIATGYHGIAVAVGHDGTAEGHYLLYYGDRGKCTGYGGRAVVCGTHNLLIRWRGRGVTHIFGKENTVLVSAECEHIRDFGEDTKVSVYAPVTIRAGVRTHILLPTRPTFTSPLTLEEGRTYSVVPSRASPVMQME